MARREFKSQCLKINSPARLLFSSEKVFPKIPDLLSLHRLPKAILTLLRFCSGKFLTGFLSQENAQAKAPAALL